MPNRCAASPSPRVVISLTRARFYVYIAVSDKADSRRKSRLKFLGDGARLIVFCLSQVSWRGAPTNRRG
ncbi:unnamed protein product [Boreogadus saida]